MVCIGRINGCDTVARSAFTSAAYLGDVGNTDMCPFAPHHLAMASRADGRSQHKFGRTEERICRHELGATLGNLEHLAPHTAITFVKDDQSVFQRPTAGV